MKYVIVTIQWAVAHGIMPLPYQRKSNDGSKVILHDEMVLPVIRRESQDPSDVILGEYDHNSVLDFLDTDPEWSGGGADETAASPGYVQAAAAKTLMNVTRAGIEQLDMTGRETNKVADLLPAWEELWGEALPLRFKLRYDGKPWRVNQAHTAQEGWRPSELPALYGLVSDHDGTQEDPIPYEPWMLLDEGLYYTDGGRLYVCTTSSNVGYDAGIDSLAALVKPVEGAGS